MDTDARLRCHTSPTFVRPDNGHRGGYSGFSEARASVDDVGQVTTAGAVRHRTQMDLLLDATDGDLLGRCRGGDREAYGVFYARHREAILSYLAHRVAEPEAAADLMAETFAGALLAVRDSARELPAVPIAWLYAIARNLLIDSLRRGRVDAAARRRLGLARLVLDDEDVERVNEIASAIDFLERSAGSLPEADWEVLRARVLDEEPYSELARRLRCSEAVVRKRVSRAKAHLRTALGGSNG